MISVAGASLIATIFPIGLLVLAVEARRVRPTIPRYQFAKWLTIAGHAITLLTVIGALNSIGFCVVSVSGNIPVSGFSAAFITVVGLVLSLEVGITFLDLVGERIGANDFLNTLGNRLEANVRGRERKRGQHMESAADD